MATITKQHEMKSGREKDSITRCSTHGRSDTAAGAGRQRFYSDFLFKKTTPAGYEVEWIIKQPSSHLSLCCTVHNQMHTFTRWTVGRSAGSAQTHTHVSDVFCEAIAAALTGVFGSICILWGHSHVSPSLT